MTDRDPVAFRCEDLSCVFETRRGSIAALDQVNVEVASHEFVCLVGPTGCGKTTLLRAIAGLIAPTSGRVVFGDPQTAGRSQSSLVFQDHGLMPWLSVLDNVTFGLASSPADRRQRGMALLGGVGLSAFAQSHPHELSMGMRQRVALARALGRDRPILLMDEPFGALDAQTRLVLQQELVRVWQARRLAILFVTHDVREAVTLGDRVLVMSGRPGRILEDLPVPIARPRDPFADRESRLGEIERAIWARLEGQVRQGLALP